MGNLVAIALSLRAARDYGPLVDAIKSFGDWSHPFPTTWIVHGNVKPAAVWKKIDPFLDEHDRACVSDLDAASMQGNFDDEDAKWFQQLGHWPG